MPGIARAGVDVAGGTIIGGGQASVYVNGALAVVLGDPVTPHGPGLHGAPFMAEASSSVFINGIPVCREGDAANCGHTASGSGNTFAGG